MPISFLTRYIYNNGITKEFLGWSLVILTFFFSTMSIGLGSIYLRQNFGSEIVNKWVLILLFLPALAFLGIEIMGRLLRSKEAIRVKHKVKDSISRKEIYQLLKSISYEENKLKFLYQLENKKVNVYYPDDWFLRISDNDVNIKLAQLEEKWMGLDR